MSNKLLLLANVTVLHKVCSLWPYKYLPSSQSKLSEVTINTQL